MRISGGEGNRVSGVRGGAGVFETTGDSDQLAARARQVNQIKT